MDAFDGNAYRKRVLASLDKDFAAADPDSGDVFLVFDLDPDVTDAAAIRARIDDVVAFWNRELTLAEVQGAGRATCPPARGLHRGPARPGPGGARPLTGCGRGEQPPRRRATPIWTAWPGSWPGASAASRPTGCRHCEPSPTGGAWRPRSSPPGSAASACSPGRPRRPSRGIRRSAARSATELDELARIEDRADGYPTLWDFLGLVPDAGREQVQARHAELVAGLGAARHNRAKTLRGDLLGHVKTRLLAEDGPARYAASLRADARDRIEADVTEKAVVAGEVSAADYETLVARVVGLGWGLDSDAARAVVRETAGALGVSLAVAPAVDYVLCGACRTPQPAPARTLEHAVPLLRRAAVHRLPGLRGRRWRRRRRCVPAAASRCGRCGPRWRWPGPPRST